MNEQEINILNYIKNHGSFERPVPLKLLKAEFDISERGIKEIIEHLRCDFKQPIIASCRTKRGGYYLPKNDTERNEGLMPYKEQILTSQKTVTAITSVDLVEYWKDWQV
ncbi:hypothetical protein Si121_01686 [Streptococcus infantarius subsp. infantarius]|uniref:hypothetical protein n=1 Tax=Streptococcus infantarius TaxID=102684 RepID=UPI00208E5A02|nr:hypothetical protein [Streptococcus infantarius]MCO4506364.1 hypothetical protein [Streptococcus infantarius subsp. infantarius]MCY7237928.1 hypothetical protein [Streptococcus infantarius]